MATTTASRRRSGARPISPVEASTTGPLLRSKVAQLADYLRNTIQRGLLTEPLAGTRLWSQQLGVSRRTLNATIKELRYDGWFTVQRRRVRLNHERIGQGACRSNAPRVVRMLLFGAYRRYNHYNLETSSALQEQLLRHGFELKWEFCPPARLREIARQPPAANELLLLASVPPVYQRLFAATTKPALVLGEVAAGVELPFINVDQAGAVRHATFRLLQRGFREVVLVHIDVDATGIRSSVAAFREAAAAWPEQPVAAKPIATALDLLSLMTTVRRVAASVGGRTGFIVVAPVPVGMVVTALWHHGVAVPEQAEVVALFHAADAIKLYPPPTHYPHPVRRVVKQLTEVATVFFDTGRVPAARKTIPTEIAKPD